MRRTIVHAICAIVAISTAGCAARLVPRITTERPAIIVRGGSVWIELTAESWKGSGRDWKPDHPGAPAVNVYIVTVEDNSGKHLCGPFAGNDVKMFHEGVLKFAFDRDGGFLGLFKKEPRLKSALNLSFDPVSGRARLVTQDQAFVGLRVVLSSGSCDVTSDQYIVRIRPQA